ncbi:MAG: gluconate 2-dehydrogenase subunit 3 family protein [Chloroflexota bacterium]
MMQIEFLHAVVDTLLPGLPATETKPALPAASEVGVAAKLAAHLETHRDKRLFVAVLEAIVGEAGGEARFVAMDEGARTAVLQTIEQSQSDAFAALLFVVSADYHESEAVMRAFGWRPTPPQPLGYPLPPFDEGKLEELVASLEGKRPLWRAA